VLAQAIWDAFEIAPAIVSGSSSLAWVIFCEVDYLLRMSKKIRARVVTYRHSGEELLKKSAPTHSNVIDL